MNAASNRVRTNKTAADYTQTCANNFFISALQIQLENFGDGCEVSAHAFLHLLVRLVSITSCDIDLLNDSNEFNVCFVIASSSFSLL